MRLKYIDRKDWPELAWIAHCNTRAPTVTIHHGIGVETASDWYCEAVWAGPYVEGAFDQTDITFGSGGRLRNGELIFVSSGSTCDRLCWLETLEGFWVSNSLPCLLETAGVELLPFVDEYPSIIESITKGLSKYQKTLPVSGGVVRLTYFSNLRWNGVDFEELEKPLGNRHFKDFSDYVTFLRQSMKEIAANAAAKERKVASYSLISTLSSGYDSSAVSVLASEVGCREAIAITSSRGGAPDSGDAVAAHLGMKLHKISRDAWRSGALPEVPFLAADGKGPDCYFGGASNLLRHRVLLTGFPGDHWRRTPADTSDQIRRGDQAGLSLTEYRLEAGFIHCPVPYFGVRAADDLARISSSDEMKNWDMPGWSKPICRRIVEEKEIDRRDFGQTKKAASVLMLGRGGFLTADGTRDMRRWLRANTRFRWVDLRSNLQFEFANVVGRLLIFIGNMFSWLLRRLERAPGLWRLSKSRPILKLAGLAERRSRMYLRRFAFQWAVHRRRAVYRSSDA